MIEIAAEALADWTHAVDTHAGRAFQSVDEIDNPIARVHVRAIRTADDFDWSSDVRSGLSSFNSFGEVSG